MKSNIFRSYFIVAPRNLLNTKYNFFNNFFIVLDNKSSSTINSKLIKEESVCFWLPIEYTPPVIILFARAVCVCYMKRKLSLFFQKSLFYDQWIYSCNLRGKHPQNCCLRLHLLYFWKLLQFENWWFHCSFLFINRTSYLRLLLLFSMFQACQGWEHFLFLHQSIFFQFLNLMLLIQHLLFFLNKVFTPSFSPNLTSSLSILSPF